mmetsp:Transcript_46564/g.110325  ORF Transcript_46564/g.110325 Transcript_46564/m.110325 type:complete len:399 (+) Transcript_46564:146-1342(+)
MIWRSLLRGSRVHYSTLISISFLVCQVVGRCGDGLLDRSEQCDDGGNVDNDGCDANCLLEPVTVQTWYATPNCTGDVLKIIVHKNREHREPDPTFLTGCSSGIDCECPTEVPFCPDGSDASFCLCRAPRCSYHAHPCYSWPPVGETWTPHRFSFQTQCFQDFPQLTTTSRLSPTGTFLINKQWRLTLSASVSGTVRADISAWELTRRRALAIGSPDFWTVSAMDRCIPAWNGLDKAEKSGAKEYELHSSSTLKTRKHCSDHLCQNCTTVGLTARIVCNTSLTCQLLAPGRCFVCSGNLDGAGMERIQGFVAWPGPPAPEPNTCQPCSSAPDNYLYQDSECSVGVGCGDCKPGMACGACGQKDAPLPACGNPRKGGFPYFWITREEKHGAHATAAAEVK